MSEHQAPELDDRAAVREVGWIAAEARALAGVEQTSPAGRVRWLDYLDRKARLLDHLAAGQHEAAALAAEARALRATIARTPAPGCACAEIGPLLIAPGTSGRTWHCQTCGAAWAPTST